MNAIDQLTHAAHALSGTRRRRDAETFAALLEGRRRPAARERRRDPDRVTGRAGPAGRAGLTELRELTALAELARSLEPDGHRPTPEFRAGLRELLVARATARVPVVPAQRPGGTSAPRSPRRWHRALAGGLVATVVAGTGAAVASTRALPGGSLYELKRGIESVQLALADTELERGRELLEQAGTRLDEVERLAASSTAGEPATRRAMARTLDQMQLATAAGASALTRAYAESGDAEPMLLLDRFAASQRERLQDLLALLEPALRARVLEAVDELAVIAGYARTVLASAGTDTVSGGADVAGRVEDVSREFAPRGGRGGAPSGAESVTGTGTGTVLAGDPLAGDPLAGDPGPTVTGPGAGPATGLGGGTGTGGVVEVTPLPTPSPALPGPTPLPVDPLPTPTPVVTVTTAPTPVPTPVPVPVPAPTCVALPPLVC